MASREAYGEILGLTKPPGEKWRIRSFEHSLRIRTDVPALEWQTSMPPSWEEMRFESADEAVAFVESEIAALSSGST